MRFSGLGATRGALRWEATVRASYGAFPGREENCGVFGLPQEIPIKCGSPLVATTACAL
jgi:hypothetical protein